ncbi:MAG: sodium:calcium antiporter [Acidimicrobiales bacterium]
MSSIVTFVVAVALTLAASAVLVTRLERVGARLGFTEALLGLVVALAANAPEISSAVTALVRGQRDVGVGVVLGSNVFNLAALLGLGAIVAGRVALHRRVVVFAGAVALWLGAVSVVTVARAVPVDATLVIALAIFVPYVVVSARPHRAAPASPGLASWLRAAVEEEEEELLVAIHPTRGGWRDAVLAAGALAVVVASSAVMEHAATTIGSREGWSGIVVGGVVLAAVTSLPNAVAAVYLASKGRGAAVLSAALNSNNLNVLFGLLVPAAILGLGHPGSSTVTAALFYAGVTVGALSLAYVGRGLGRVGGAAIIVAYGAYVGVLIH